MQAVRPSMARRIDWPLVILGVLVVASLVGFGVYYYLDRYVHPNETVLERQARNVEDMVKKNPQNPQLRVSAADLYLHTGLVDEAIAQANEALKIKADYADAFLLLGRAYKQAGNLDTAIKNYSRFIELTKDAPLAALNTSLENGYYELGLIYYGQDKAQEASDALTAALKIDHTDANAHYYLGMVYQKKQDHTNAVAEFEQALRFDPSYGPPYLGLAASYTALGKAADASYATAMVALTQGKYTDAATQLETLTRANPDLSKAYYGLGLAYDKLGKVDQAIAALTKYTEAYPDDLGGQDALTRVSKEK